MTGRVDGDGHALVSLLVRHPRNNQAVVLEGWIDTGFTGQIALPRATIASLGLQHSATVPGELADGTKVLLDTFTCLLDWFGQVVQVEAVAKTGAWPLIGIDMLLDRELTVDYRKRSVSIT